MRDKNIRRRLLVLGFSITAIGQAPLPSLRAGDPPAQKDDSKSKEDPKVLAARAKWENVVQFYGDEETGEWSLRIADKDVHDKASFEFLELWHFNPTGMCWEQLKTGRLIKQIVMPKEKAGTEPTDSEMLIELKDIPVKTGGVWFAKWKIDDVECCTPMTVGGGKPKNKVPAQVPRGMVKFIVPLTLDKSEAMIIPDPRIYCVPGGPGKPTGKDAKK